MTLTLASNGDLVQHSHYQPYGDAANIQPSRVQPYGFSGKERDDSGLMYFEARYYDPVSGRFISPDPLFAEQMDKCLGLVIECNLYQYTGNNPVMYVDYSGTETVKLGAEFNAPIIGEGIKLLMEFFSPDSSRVYPEGVSANANFSFPGLSGSGEYGFALSIDAVVGGEVGSEGKLKNKDGSMNWKQLLRGSVTGELDWNWTKETTHESTSGLGDNEISAFYGIFGGQVSKNKKGETTGVGVKGGLGYNVGASASLPLFSIGFDETEGLYFGGEIGDNISGNGE